MTGSVPSALLLVELAGAYLALGIAAVVRRLQIVVERTPRFALAGPALVWAVVVAYAALGGLPVVPRAGAFGCYLVAPALLLVGRVTPPGRGPVRELAAVALLWLPIEFHLLPSLPGPGDVDLSKLPGLVDALFLFLVVRQVPDVGYTFALRARDVGVAVAAFFVYTLVAVPVGLLTGFIAWHPRVSMDGVVLRPVLIYVLIALPEEFLFRGLIQNLLTRWWGSATALPVAAIVFGLAHLPDPRYVVLATLAGVAYGLVYADTSRITASAITHALVDAVWVLVLRG